MDTEEPTYDENGVQLLIDTQDHIKGLASADFHRARRCQMIRGAIEGQIEHLLPRPSMRVVEMLCKAMIIEAALIDSDTTWVREQVDRIINHIASRPDP